MAKHRRNRLGVRYRPVSRANILRSISNPRRYGDVGEELWPHLAGRGSTKGGPSAAQYAAACQLGKLRKLGLAETYPDPEEQALLKPGEGPYNWLWVITAAGRRWLHEKGDDHGTRNDRDAAL